MATVAAALCAATGFAQSTLFNAPSTDIVEIKKAYVEFDFISHLERHTNGGFQTYLPRLVYGVRKGVEAGLNVGITHSATPGLVCVQPNIKWRFLSLEKPGVAMSAGAIAYFPIKAPESSDTIGLFYGNVSKRFSGHYGPRFSVGAYGLAGIKSADADKAGAMLGYEQPLGWRISFVADWFSGRNGFGYVTPGLSFTLPKAGLLNIGYSVGNSGRKNNGLFVYYGKVL
jgi:hypothetical protein